MIEHNHRNTFDEVVAEFSVFRYATFIKQSIVRNRNVCPGSVPEEFQKQSGLCCENEESKGVSYAGSPG